MGEGDEIYLREWIDRGYIALWFLRRSVWACISNLHVLPFNIECLQTQPTVEIIQKHKFYFAVARLLFNASDKRIEKNLETNYRGQIDILPRHLPREPEEYHETFVTVKDARRIIP